MASGVSNAAATPVTDIAHSTPFSYAQWQYNNLPPRPTEEDDNDGPLTAAGATAGLKFAYAVRHQNEYLTVPRSILPPAPITVWPHGQDPAPSPAPASAAATASTVSTRPPVAFQKRFCF